jgi:hypothetical protein
LVKRLRASPLKMQRVPPWKTLLVLDTTTGGEPERLYARLGWTHVGTIPDYAFWPDGRLGGTTIFYKRI